jgi:Uma2 family endonuclease
MAHAVISPTTVVCDREWTIDDLEELPRHSRYEILDGVLYMSPLPLLPHNLCADNLKELLSAWLRPRRLGRALLPGTGIHRDPSSYVDPDVTVFRSTQLPKGKRRPATAAIAVEVISPSNRRMGYRQQREEFLAGRNVPELWYVDTDERCTEVLRLEDEAYRPWRRFSGDDTVTTLELPGFEFPLTAAWEDLN